METSKITVEALIAANAQKVWDYYTLPEHITQWNFASDDWHCPKATNDLRVGGRYCASMAAKDGSFEFDFEAIYEEVIPNECIRYTMGKELGNGRQASVVFKSMDNQTMATIIFDAEEENSVDMQRDGWQAILNNFKKHVESN